MMLTKTLHMMMYMKVKKYQHIVMFMKVKEHLHMVVKYMKVRRLHHMKKKYIIDLQIIKDQRQSVNITKEIMLNY